MRRTILAAATAVLTAAATLTGLAEPAAAGSVVTVPGHNYEAAGVNHWSNQCGAPWYQAAEAPAAIYRAGGLTGSHATGFDFAHSDSEAGPWVFVRHPSQLTTLQMGVRTTPGDVGHLVAYYTPPGDTDILVGVVDLPASINGWGSFLGLANALLTWHWIHADGTYMFPATPAPYRQTIRGIAQVYGTDNEGAVVMVTFGCEGDPFYFDKFVVGSTTYDFEGVPTAASLGVSGGSSSVTVDTGRGVSFGGYAAAAADGHGSAGGVFSGTGSLVRVTGGRTVVARGSFAPGSAAAFAVPNIAPGTYVFVSDATDRFESATSAPITVNVRSRIKGRLQHGTVRAGSTVVVSGRVTPGAKGARLRLQQKSGHRWRTIASGRSRSHGAFRLAKRAGGPGTMKLRVVVSGYAGYQGDATRTFRVHVVRAPKPSRPAPVVTVVHTAPVTAPPKAPAPQYTAPMNMVGHRPF